MYGAKYDALAGESCLDPVKTQIKRDASMLQRERAENKMS